MADETPTEANAFEPEPALKKPESVLDDIYRGGADAVLSDNTFDVDHERRYAVQLTTEQRAYLAKQVEAWRKAKTEDAEKAKVLGLLQDLKNELEPPTIQRIGSDVTAVGTEVVSDIADFTKVQAFQTKKDSEATWEKITTKVGGDWNGFWFDKNIGTADKIVTAGKYLAAASGLTWLAWKIGSWWNKSKIKRSFLLAAAGIPAFIFGTKLIANTTKRTTGPRLAPDEIPKTIASPSDVPELKSMAGQNILRLNAPVIVNGTRTEIIKIKNAQQEDIWSVKVGNKIFSSDTLSGAIETDFEAIVQKDESIKIPSIFGDRILPKTEYEKIIKTLRDSNDERTSISVDLIKSDNSHETKTIEFKLENNPQ